MSFIYVEGFDSLQTTTDVQEDGWRSEISSGVISSGEFGFSTGRLNARSFGAPGIIGNQGLGRPLPMSTMRNLHFGWARKGGVYNNNVGVEKLNTIFSLQITGNNLFQKTVFVVSHLERGRRFALSVNENTNLNTPSVSTVTQRSFEFPAPQWFSQLEWNYFELITANDGREFYFFINGEPVGQFVNANITFPVGGGFSQFFFGKFNGREQWDYPVDRTGVGTGGFSEDSTPYFLDDLFVRVPSGVIPLGDYRMNDGFGTSDFSVEFTPTVGSTTNFENLDELTPDGDVSIVSSTAPTKTDLYGHGAAISTGAIPATLSLKTRVYAKNGNASPVNFVGLISDGLTTREGGNYSLSTVYANRSLIYNTDPNNASWTKSTIEGVKVGFQHKVI